MDELQIKQKLESMKKARKTLGTVTLIVSLIAIVLLIVYNLVNVTFMQVQSSEAMASEHVSICAADFTEGFYFPGWQMVFWGIGGQVVAEHIQLFKPNPITIVGVVGTLLVLIICTATYNKGKNQSKAIKEFISGGCLAYSACVLSFFIVPVAKLFVDNNPDFITRVVEAEGTIFQPTTLAILIGVLLLVCAAVKIYNGCFLLQQRAFAKKNAPKKAS